MKNTRPITFILLATFAAVSPLRAHEHIEIGFDPSNPNRLLPYGPASHQATFFPGGEMPSSSFIVFPGGTYATELTFSAFDNIDSPPGDAFVRVKLLAVSGPAGGTFSFWEVGSTSPTWTRAAGWSASGGDEPGLEVSEDNTGYGHTHGRAFTCSKAGVYDATFQAVDDLGNYTSSLPFVVRLTAIDPPKLSIRMESNAAKMTFTGRNGLNYDVQKSTTLQPNSWTTLDTLGGTGSMLEFSEPVGGQTRVFYRIVEY
jgi:hypothetical protein